MSVAAVALPPACVHALTQRTVTPGATFAVGFLRVQRFGDPTRRAVILVPGLACGPWVWNVQINELSKRYAVYAVTLPGFDGLPMAQGGSLLTHRSDLMAHAAADLHTLIASHGLISPIIIGHSLGGTLAVLFAETYPNDTTNVVTVEGGYPEAKTRALRDERAAADMRPYEGIPQSALGPALRQNMLQYTITKKADVDAAVKLAARSQPDAIVAWGRDALSLDLTPELHRIIVPFTAIVPFDPVIDPYQGFKTQQAKRAAYASWVLHARLGEMMMISPSRHFVMIDRPSAFATALAAAMDRDTP